MGKPPTAQWLQRHRRVISWLLLIAAGVAAVCGVFMALPLAFAGIAIEALLVKRIRTKRRLVTRVEQPFAYWIYVGLWTFLTFYALWVPCVHSLTPPRWCELIESGLTPKLD